MYEVEIKAKAKKDTLARLRALGSMTKEVSEKDTYYRHPCRDFAKTDEALRVRESEGRLLLTYKGPKMDATTKTRQEENMEVFKEIYPILASLGFKEVRKVEKKRELYTLKDALASFDSVKGLGQFMELEICAEKKSEIPKAKKKLFSVFSELGFEKNDSITSSYLELLLAKK